MKILKLANAVAFALTLATGVAFAQADPVEATRNAERAKADAAAAEVSADLAEDRADAADRADAPDARAAEKRADAAEVAAKAAANAAEDADESAEDVRDGDADAAQEAGRARAGADVAAAGAEVAAEAAALNANSAAGAMPPMSAEQKAMMDAWAKAGMKGPQHEQLAGMVGEWDAKVSMWMDPAAPAQTSTGIEVSSSMYDGKFIQSKFTGTYAGQPFEGTSLMGYDNVRGKYTSTWHDSTGTGIFMAMGDYDPATRTYTLRGSMADPMKPSELTPVRQVIRIVDNNHHEFEWHETHGGNEMKTMEISYTRR
ncbi:MAG: DUF1579 domain-containing protein [Lysobacterales bacterium]